MRFSQGLERLFTDPNHVFLEVGPGQTLAALARRHPGKKEEHAFVVSLRHPEESRADEALFMESVGRLWLAGVRPDWAVLHAGQRRRRVRLPTYPFEHKRYWPEPGRKTKETGRIRRSADPGEWIYQPSWKRVRVPSVEPRKLAARWLLFSDPHGLGARLEAALAASGSDDRTARFVCALALVDEGRVTFEATGTVEGRLVPRPRGTGGFGYDPIFFFPPFGMTLAEAGERKAEVSHRAKAFQKLRDYLERRM